MLSPHKIGRSEYFDIISKYYPDECGREDSFDFYIKYGYTVNFSWPPLTNDVLSNYERFSLALVDAECRAAKCTLIQEALDI